MRVTVPLLELPECVIRRIGLESDIPNPFWLAEKVDYAKSCGLNRWGVPHMGVVTGTYQRRIEIPVAVLAGIRGARNEQANVRSRDLDAIREIMATTGKLPTDNGEEYLPFICVAYDGSAWVIDGNHRIMAAVALAWDRIPVEVRYFDGGELADGPLAPARVAEWLRCAHDTDPGGNVSAEDPVVLMPTA